MFTNSSELQDNVMQYLRSLGEKERQAYKIAIGHLGTSFNIVKSTGYVEWFKNKNV